MNPDHRLSYTCREFPETNCCHIHVFTCVMLDSPMMYETRQTTAMKISLRFRRTWGNSSTRAVMKPSTVQNWRWSRVVLRNDDIKTYSSVSQGNLVWLKKKNHLYLQKAVSISVLFSLPGCRFPASAAWRRRGWPTGERWAAGWRPRDTPKTPGQVLTRTFHRHREV